MIVLVDIADNQEGNKKEFRDHLFRLLTTSPEVVSTFPREEWGDPPLNEMLVSWELRGQAREGNWFPGICTTIWEAAKSQHLADNLGTIWGEEGNIVKWNFSQEDEDVENASVFQTEKFLSDIVFLQMWRKYSSSATQSP
ncbi:hypothetical protein E3J85_02145 [Patescibacteria group bacterium]|nr:MAG: hypothetical protein E3J85_02145 [Patescibacteria group bacterium]